jgi:hypothetical protein
MVQKLLLYFLADYIVSNIDDYMSIRTKWSDKWLNFKDSYYRSFNKPAKIKYSKGAPPVVPAAITYIWYKHDKEVYRITVWIMGQKGAMYFYDQERSQFSKFNGTIEHEYWKKKKFDRSEKRSQDGTMEIIYYKHGAFNRREIYYTDGTHKIYYTRPD